MKLALLASGTGSNVDSLLREIESGAVPAECACVVSNTADAGVREVARRHAVPMIVVPAVGGETPDQYERRLVLELASREPDYVVLLGWMRILRERFLAAYGGRTINLHPSLLPAFRGRDAVGQALAAGVSETGASVHWVDAGVDTGPVIAQRPVPVRAGDTRDTLQRRIQEVEHRLVPEVVRALALGHIHPPDTQSTQEAKHVSDIHHIGLANRRDPVLAGSGPARAATGAGIGHR